MTSREWVRYLIRRTIAIGLIAAMVSAFPVGLAQADTSSTPAPSPDGVSIGGGSSSGAAGSGSSSGQSAITIGPGSQRSSGARTAPENTDSVIGNAGVDKATEEFRKKLAAQQARVDAFTAQLEELDRELSLASEAYNAASEKLASVNKQVHTAELDLGTANTEYGRVSDILDNQVGTMYRSGSYSPVEILLDAKSLSDFLSRLKFLNTVGTDSTEVLEEYSKVKAELEDQVFKLKNAKRIAESLEFELKARKIEVQLRIAERQQLFSSAQSDLLTLLSSQAATRQAEESQLLKQILSGASKAGIQVAPGSPVETVLAYHGVPYLWGGATPAGFDCSGLILYVMRQHGVELPHYSGSQFLLGEKVSAVELQPGDAVFFGSPIHHVGMYIGGGYFVHAPRTGDYVKISRLADRSDFAGARRYNWMPRIGPIDTAVSSTSSALSSVN